MVIRQDVGVDEPRARGVQMRAPCSMTRHIRRRSKREIHCRKDARAMSRGGEAAGQQNLRHAARCKGVLMSEVAIAAAPAKGPAFTV